MNTMTSRISKILTGFFLIGLTMTSNDGMMSNEMLYSLIALPIIFSGLFDWRPMEFLLFKLARLIRLEVNDVSFTTKGV